MKAYKIVEYDGVQYKALFHGTNGTRVLEPNVWLDAQIRERAKDGSSPTIYRSGWHTLPSLEECKEYLKNFKNRLNQLVICEVEIAGEIWPKTHSRANVLLSTRIKLGEPYGFL